MTDEMFEIVVFIAVFFIGVVPAIVIWVRAWDQWGVMIQDTPNSNESAGRAFMDVLREAKKTVRIHDDGNDFDASIYNQDAVVEKVLQMLSDGIEIRCLFNQEECRRLKMVEHSCNQYPQNFLVRVTKGGRPDDDIHGKVADDGTMAYLSRHGLGSDDRKGRSFDCRDVSPKTRKMALGSYIKWFDDQFKIAAHEEAA